MRSPTSLRLAALLLSLVYLPLGLVWTYGLALFVLPFGVAGLWLLRVAERRSAGGGTGAGERRLHQAARGVNWLAFAASAVALALTR